MEDYIYTSVYEFSWSPDGSQILTAGNDSIINLWNAEDGTLIRSFPLSSLNTGQLKFRWNQEGTQFISYGSDKAQVWNLNNDSPRFEFASEINFRNVYAKWNNNEDYILTLDTHGHELNIARVWDAKTGELVHVYTRDINIISVEWNAEGNGFIAGGSDGTIEVWEVNTNEPNTNEPIHIFEHEPIEDLSDLLAGNYTQYRPWLVWSPDGTSILSFMEENMKLWDVDGDRLIHTFSHGSNISAVQWSSDGMRVLSLGGSNAKLWDANTGDFLFTFSHDQEINGAVWNNDETQIITFSSDGSAKVWSTVTGSLIYTLRGDGRSVIKAEWNQDETQIHFYTQNDYGLLTYDAMYSFPTSAETRISLACSRTTRDFTWEEWQLFNLSMTYELTCPTQNHLIDCSVPSSARPPEHTGRWTEQCSDG